LLYGIIFDNFVVILIQIILTLFKKINIFTNKMIKVIFIILLFAIKKYVYSGRWGELLHI